MFHPLLRDKIRLLRFVRRLHIQEPHITHLHCRIQVMQPKIATIIQMHISLDLPPCLRLITNALQQRLNLIMPYIHIPAFLSLDAFGLVTWILFSHPLSH